MRYFFLFIVMLFTAEVFPQQEAAPNLFIHLSKVEKPPFSEDCDENFPGCTVVQIEQHLIQNLIKVGPLTSGTSGKTDVSARVVIDTIGQISWASVKGLPAETNGKLAERLKRMPAFLPGEHEGQKANVIVDLKVPLYLWEAENFASEVSTKEELDLGPVWPGCQKAEDKKTCTGESLSTWINRNVNTRVLPEPGFYALTASFVLGPDGEIGRIVVQGGGDKFAPEIVNTLKKLPRLEPAKSGEEPVAVSFTMPITLRIASSK